MNQNFTAFFPKTVERLKTICFCIKRSGILSLVPLFVSLTVNAQGVTFSETFDNTPQGEVPEGWKWYSVGGSGGNNWVRSSYGLFGGRLMTSGVEYAIPEQIDEDWLVTPQIVPAAGDHLMFDGGQEYVWDDYGSTFHILISRATSNRADFTETLASWTEPEFLTYPYGERLMVDLSAFEGIPIYVAFVHKNPVTGEGADPDLPPPRSENWYLDNVEIRPLKALDYSGGEIFGSFTSVIRVATSGTSVVVGFIVRASGDTGSANITSMTFTTAGSSPLVKIRQAVVYTTYGDSFIASSEDEGIVYADVFGSTVDPGSTFTIEGDQLLHRGDTYFWLFYTLEADEKDLTYPYPQVDATFEKVVINTIERDATVPSTDGSHAVVPATPVNDNYANAIELLPSGMPVRYGSYNTRATYEAEFEKLAYCATPIYASAMDGANSVWWRFRAPGEGLITVDLSDCNFNTLLLIQDANFDQIACNKDIDQEAYIFQSKITDFPVEEGKDYYIRVTGEGAYPGDPNTASGVVHMDFSFTTPTGVEESFQYPLSAVYPNPAQDIVYIDITLTKQKEVILEVVDMIGRPVLSESKGIHPAGTHKQLSLDASSLPSGTYVVRLRGSAESSARKLVVLN